MSDVISRERLSFQKFAKSGEVPPADAEQFIVWKFRNMVIDERDAILELADHRRYAALVSERSAAMKAHMELKQVPSRRKSKAESLAEYRAAKDDPS